MFIEILFKMLLLKGVYSFTLSTVYTLLYIYIYIYIYIYVYTFTFKCSHFADAFIQSDLQLGNT